MYKNAEEMDANSILLDTKEKIDKANEWNDHGRKIYCIGRNGIGIVINYRPENEVEIQRKGLIMLYEEQSIGASPFMGKILDAALHLLKTTPKQPKDIEQWVVDTEKMWRTFK